MSPAAGPKGPADHVTPHGRVPPEESQEWLPPEWPPLWGHDSIQEEKPLLSPWNSETGNQIQNRQEGKLECQGNSHTQGVHSRTHARLSLCFPDLESPGQGPRSLAV